MTQYINTFMTNYYITRHFLEKVVGKDLVSYSKMYIDLNNKHCKT